MAPVEEGDGLVVDTAVNLKSALLVLFAAAGACGELGRLGKKR